MEEIGTRVTIKPHMVRWSLDGTLTFSSGGTYPVRAGSIREIRRPWSGARPRRWKGWKSDSVSFGARNCARPGDDGAPPRRV